MKETNDNIPTILDDINSISITCETKDCKFPSNPNRCTLYQNTGKFQITDEMKKNRVYINLGCSINDKKRNIPYYTIVNDINITF